MPKASYTCAACGASFEKYPCQVKGTHVYCSLMCVAAAKRHGSVLACAQCGDPFYRRFGEQDLGTRERQFCSRSCYMAWRREHRGDTYPKIGGVHEHRLVAERKLGRPLASGEVVHHIDGNKQNNSPENLAVLPSQAEHARVHFANE